MTTSNELAYLIDVWSVSLHRHGVGLIFAVHADNMRAHRASCAKAVAAQDRHHHPVMFGVRFRQPAEIAELGAAKRLHPRPGRQRDFRDITVCEPA